jgi:membrane-bound lytic murein transglycosylase D
MIKLHSFRILSNKFNTFILCIGLMSAHISFADTAAINLAAAASSDAYISTAPYPNTTPTAAPTDSASQSAGNSQDNTADLWDRIRMGFGMDTLDTPLVETHINWYAQRPDYVRRMVERSRRYLYHILGEVEKRGMPTEIALLPMVESAFNPMAYSASHASGIWQFIPSTGKDFGLKQNGWYDGRRDIIAATDAALDYLTKLHDQFGTWELALAAYNCGEGCVARAIAKNQAQGLPTDYLSLNLPTETRHYVPKLLAIKQIIIDPTSVGLNLDSIPNQAYFTTVTLDKPIDVSLAAKLANMPVNEFVSLNPAYNKPVVRSDTPAQLLLPVDKVDTFSNNLQNYDRPLVTWQVYAAKIGERISTIAKKFNVTVAWLKEHNPVQLSRKGKLTSDHALMVPLKGNTESAATLADKTGSHNLTNKIALADTTTGKHQEKDAPTLDNSNISANSEHSHQQDRAVREVTVKKGDTLYNLSTRYHVSTHDLVLWNKIKHNQLKPGQHVIVSAPDEHHAASGKNAHKEKADKNKDVKKADKKSQEKREKTRHYTVKKGDTLSSIAQKNDIAIDDIQHWNHLKPHSTLKPGAKLVLK